MEMLRMMCVWAQVPPHQELDTSWCAAHSNVKMHLDRKRDPPPCVNSPTPIVLCHVMTAAPSGGMRNLAHILFLDMPPPF
jgi:hypothetical protein